ncbi:MAG: hypothetical protein HY892_15440 [Deltaproteobacteria bacterium]|nr:hypothetical protein [Deltaproteobacteria bacterium]
MDEQELRQLERLSPIVAVAIELGLPLRGNLGQCFRRERHTGEEEPTLFFQVAQNRFFCKTCREVQGGVVDFVSQHQGWDRRQAIDWLVHRLEFDRQTKERYSHKGKKK